MGNALLDGELELTLINGFIPNASQTFVVLNANSLLGVFDNVTSGQRLATSDGDGSFLVHYGVGSTFDPALIVLSSFQAGGLPGDRDNDGDVDLDDFARFPECLGGPGVPFGPTECECIDPNADGAVDLSDFAVFQAALTGS